MKVSDIIEQFLLDMLENDSDITLKRNELAGKFSCAPSQINYVIQTRFTDQRGYMVESQRGGGGFIRIRKVNVDKSNYIMHVVNSIGDAISYSTALAMLSNMESENIVTHREKNIMCAAVSDRIIPFNAPVKDNYRARVFKNMLVSMI